MTKETEAQDLNLKVKGWLKDLGYRIESGSDSSVLWAILATPPNAVPCMVTLEVETALQIELSLPIMIQNYRRSLAGLPIERQREVIFETRQRLLQFGVAFNLPMELPEFIILEVPILIEELSLSSLVEGLRKVQSAFLAFVWSFQSALGIDDFPGGIVEDSSTIH